MPLKYQKEIDNFQLGIPCPDGVFPPDPEIETYRFSYSPIDHELNFLPNVVFDRKINYPFDYDSAIAIIKCKRCGSSYYTKPEGLRKKWNKMTGQNKENLGYTHIAYGKLNKEDGLMREPDQGGHFGFYESDKAELSKKFVLIEEL